MTTLNVVYIPGTALQLGRFALTLRQWSSCRVRLVANGCSPGEADHLQALADSADRLEFVRLREGDPLSHGQALDRLHDECGDPVFAFADSDLFAVGPFLPAPGATLTCALPPAAFWDEAEEARQRRRHEMGCTYLALYDCASLRRVREQYGVGFDKSSWEKLSPACRNALSDTGYVRPRYDTGKVLNALLTRQGGSLEFADAGNLRHLGGASRTRMLRTWTWRRWLGALRANGPEAFRRWRLRNAKRKANRYFADLFDALALGRPRPELPRLQPALRRRIAEITTHIERMYDEPRAR